MSGYPGPQVWARRFGARFDPNGPAAHKRRFAGFRMMTRGPPLALPPSVDLRQGFGPVTNQTYNSCVAESLTAAYNFMARKSGKYNPVESGDSRLFLYYQARLTDGTENRDEGAFIGSGAQSLVATGLCEEQYHPYSTGPFVPPTKAAYADALDHKALSVKMVDQNLGALKQLLASGCPVVIGFLVFPSIQSPQVEATGDIPLPSPQEQPLGGHAVVLCGYDDATQKFFLRNSWGTQWGKQGYGSLPYAYLTNSYLSQDFWIIEAVNDDSIPPQPQPDPWPDPAPLPVQCCTTCDPCSCCCARTRMQASRLPTAATYSANRVLPVTTTPWYPTIRSYC